MKRLSLAALLLAGAAGCDDDVLKLLGPPDAASLDGSAAGDGSPDATRDGTPPSDCHGAKADDSACETSQECCSGFCGVDPHAQVTCRPTTGCLGAGRPCAYAGACCSLSCASGACAPEGTCAQITG